MTESRSIAEARNGLTMLLREVEAGRTVRLTRRGKPVAVLVSVHEYERLHARPGSFWSALTRFRRTRRMASQGFEGDPFDGVRDPFPGRRVSL